MGDHGAAHAWKTHFLRYAGWCGLDQTSLVLQLGARPLHSLIDPSDGPLDAIIDLGYATALDPVELLSHLADCAASLRTGGLLIIGLRISATWVAHGPTFDGQHYWFGEEAVRRRLGAVGLRADSITQLPGIGYGVLNATRISV